MAKGIAGGGICAVAMLVALLELALLELVKPHCITPVITCKQCTSFGIACKQLGRAYLRTRS